MGLYLLDYGAGNVQSLANSINSLGHSFTWISSAEDFKKATSLIFPGVGAFESAIKGLESKGLLEPLREYVLSGRPYFGICIGMQVLFESSSEAPSVKGLGVVPSPITPFDSTDKAVPHIGWNAVDLVQSNDPENIKPSEYYYFVHSFCAKYDPQGYAEAAKCAYTTTQYGKELFISSVRKANVLGTQFHPEKSGAAGLAFLDAWLRKPESAHASAPEEAVASSSTLPAIITPSPIHRLTKRIIACMDVRANDAGDLVVTKGDQYDVREKAETAETGGAVRNLGKPVALAEQYYAAGADELCLLNITSFRHSPLRDQPMLAVVRAAAERVFVPLTIGGGIKDSVDPDGTKRPALEVAGTYFRAGADKVSIGSEAVIAVEKMLANGGKGDGTSAIETIAKAYGRQAVVVSVDPRRAFVDPATYEGPYKTELVHGKPGSKDEGKAWWYQCTISGGRENRPLSAVQLVQGAAALGAGEILLNSIDRDGSGLGFDLDLVSLVKNAVSIPVVASSGAGSVEHFTEVFTKTNVEAALAAGIFHRGEVRIQDVKSRLRESNVIVRV
ncbi:imidazole glycerol phosphate synthase HisHF [Cylindrobasidium torrendii FP15055 ss-10]|uniref:Imidazole glycerol phosphate synthase hisHF n=1 Tax=Cylindrobasidium torrendii FP15055 ss-10 TaxID=1314674 RepID=A0A0D7BLK0_9AGAR|nr:imidazole glycerol phosphate synthase HisHF [Cylindrobasidium torrendii FP15055 ss-10]